MRDEELVDRHPVLYHLAHGDPYEAWAGIRRYGLLSASVLVEQWGLPVERAQALLTGRRTTEEVLEHAVHGRAVLRDQKPLDESKLAATLDDMTVPEWLGLLNGLVFLSPDQARLDAMLAVYGDRPRLVLEIDTQMLLTGWASQVLLSRLNTGAVRMPTHRRGLDTFVPLARWPSTRTPKIAEVAVTTRLGHDGDDLAHLLRGAYVREPDGSRRAMEEAAGTPEV